MHLTTHIRRALHPRDASSSELGFALSSTMDGGNDVTVGAIVIYLFASITALVLATYILHWLFSIIVPVITRWRVRRRARRRLRRVLRNSDKFPTFSFDPEAAMASNATLPEAAASQPPITNSSEADVGHATLPVESDDNPTAKPSVLATQTPTRGLCNSPAILSPTAEPPAEPAGGGTTRTTCSICLDDYRAGDEIRELPCRHDFHAPCIHPWLERAILEHQIVCPVCRSSWPVAESADHASVVRRRRMRTLSGLWRRMSLSRPGSDHRVEEIEASSVPGSAASSLERNAHSLTRLPVVVDLEAPRRTASIRPDDGSSASFHMVEVTMGTPLHQTRP